MEQKSLDEIAEVKLGSNLASTVTRDSNNYLSGNQKKPFNANGVNQFSNWQIDQFLEKTQFRILVMSKLDIFPSSFKL